MAIPEKIILDIWEFIVQNYGMTCGIACIFLALHLLWWERCRQFWCALGHGISTTIRCIFWPARQLLRKAVAAWKESKQKRRNRRIIAKFDRHHPELKDKYTDYGKIQFMRITQDSTSLRLYNEASRRKSLDPSKSYAQHLDETIKNIYKI